MTKQNSNYFTTNNKKRLKKPLYGGFLPLTGPDAKCGSILRRAHFLSPPYY